MKYLLILTALIASSLNGAKASHVIGGEITYEYLSTGKYQVYISIIRDCNGIQLSQSNLLAIAGTDTVVLSNQTKISTRDVTGILPRCPIQSRCSGTYQYGFEEQVFTGVLDLSAYSHCNWNLSWEQCCRNGAIITGSANENFYITADLNTCLVNSAPKFNSQASFLLCHNRDQILDLSAVDSIDGDTLSYHLVAPLQEYSTSVSYAGQFNSDRPLTFFGFPNTNLSWPAGFRLDTNTGYMRFRPTSVNQVAPLAIKVREWRTINGVKTLISEVTRDYQVTVVSCPNNNAPEIKPPYSRQVCVGDTVRIPIFTEDDDSDDTTYISVKDLIPGATFTANNGQVKRATGEVIWVPDRSHISSSPHNFFAIVEDNACPLPGSSIRAMSVFVRDTLATPIFSAGPNIQVSDSSNAIQLQGTDSFNVSGNVFWWSSGDGSFSNNNIGNAVYTFGSGDRNTCNLMLIRGVNPNLACAQVDSDTMYIERQFSDLNAGKDTALDIPFSQWHLSPNVSDSLQSIHWTSDGLGYFDDSTAWDATYIPDSLDWNRCGLSFFLNRKIIGNCADTLDTVSVELNPLLEIQASNYTGQNDSFQLTVRSSQSDSITWSSGAGQSGILASSQVITYYPNAIEKGQTYVDLYALQVNDCETSYDTLRVNIFPNALGSIKNDLGIRVYPNPAEDQISISIDGEHKIRKIEIVGLLGQSLIRESGSLSGQLITLNTEILQPGVYTLLLELQSGRIAYRTLIIK